MTLAPWLNELWFAVALGGVFLLRLVWVEFTGGGSRLPLDAPRWERGLSRAVHYGIYAMVFAIVLTGLAIAAGASPPPVVFGLSLAPLDAGLSRGLILQLHESFAAGLTLLIAVHLCGAVWHWAVRKDGVWE